MLCERSFELHHFNVNVFSPPAGGPRDCVRPPAAAAGALGECARRAPVE